MEAKLPGTPAPNPPRRFARRPPGLRHELFGAAARAVALAPRLPGGVKAPRRARPGGSAGETAAAEGLPGEAAEPVVSRAVRVNRNDPCPCGSGRKYKRCHGGAAPPAETPAPGA